MNQTLKRGDTISVISPSATIKDNPEAMALYNRGVDILNDMGLKVQYGQYASGKEYYKSGTAAERISDIEEAYKDSKVKAIFCTQGGDNSNELLSDIDWNIIKQNPKKLFGVSDITVLLNAIYAHTGETSYHGIDVIWVLGKNATEYTVNHLKDFLFTNYINYRHHPDYLQWKVIKPGKATGVCLGGCLPSFCLLLGTDSDPIRAVSKPFIFIIESIGESFSRIESYIAQIFQQPNFKKYCNGIIIGHFFMCKEEILENNRNVSDIILEYGKKYNFPVIEVGELGHAVENMIFPIGGQLTIEANNSNVVIAADLTTHIK